MASCTLLAVILALAFCQALSGDPSPLQDFCVADQNSSVYVNGFICKDPKHAIPEDFFFAGLDKPASTANKVGFNMTMANAAMLSIARLDYTPYGLNLPPSHPRASKILTVLQGSLYVDFVTSNPDNMFFIRTLEKGDMFVFPQGLAHFQFNVGGTDAVVIAALSRQNPGVITVANTVFGSKPDIFDDILTKAFQVNKEIVEELKAQFR